MDAPEPAIEDSPPTPLLAPLLGVHSAPTAAWLVDAACNAAERGLGALYGLVFLTDASGHLIGERSASRAQARSLTKLNEALETNLIAIRLDPQERPVLAAVLQDGHARAVEDLDLALPLPSADEAVRAAQKHLGVGSVVLAPLYWNGEGLGVLLLLMPAGVQPVVAQAGLLGHHVAVALHNLRAQEAGRKRGELDAVRWVYDERRFLEQLAQETRRAHRHDRPLSILLLRVENLEDLRARYGRFLAERLLRQVAGQLEDAMRDTDFLGASGDDGFAAILIEADKDGARRAEERLLEGLASMQLPNTDLPGLQAQYACATATVPDDGSTSEELTAAAEARLEGAQLDPEGAAATS